MWRVHIYVCVAAGQADNVREICVVAEQRNFGFLPIKFLWLLPASVIERQRLLWGNITVMYCVHKKMDATFNFMFYMSALNMICLCF